MKHYSPSANLFAPALVWLGCSSPLLAQEAQPSLQSRVDAVIAEMRSNSFQTRELGSKHLLALPAEALPLLDAATASSTFSLEARSRILRDIEILRGKARDASKLRRAREMREWEFTNAIAGYTASPAAASPYDTDVQTAFRQVADLETGSRPSVHPVVPRDRFAALDAAVRKGCRDPLLRAYYLRIGYLTGNIKHDAAMDAAQGLFDDLMASHYAPSLKIYAGVLFTAALKFVDPEKETWSDDDRKAFLVQCTDLWPEAVNSNVPDSVLEHLAERLYIANEPYRQSSFTDFETIYTPWVKRHPEDAGPYAYKAAVYVHYAWEGRGGDWAANVAAKQWKLFGERLNIATAAAEKAYRLNVTDAWSSCSMVSACMGQDAPDSEMEKWFTRAIQADPDDTAPYFGKMEYLRPRWHGTHEQMLSFGRECASHGNPASEVPLMILRAHQLICEDDAQPDYWKNPDVWNDISPAFTHVLEAHKGDPLENYYRTWFASVAVDCGQWTVACDQFRLLGNHPHPLIYPTAAAYNAAREKAERMATTKP